MRISAKAEYACIAVFELAVNHAEPHPVRVKAIADAHDIPQRFLVQILLQLKAVGLVESVRGASGGYQLARPPEEISLADVINAIDQVATPSSRKTSPKRRNPVVPMNSAGVHALRAIWREIDLEQQRLLEATTFADLVRRTQLDSGLSYQI
ncbi:MAG: Rrf2 family transcriptional regulator [Gemmataceae bacterium]|nr:Rrf2 family transcriptional regulator [Gemmataceae bacterium]